MEAFAPPWGMRSGALKHLGRAATDDTGSVRLYE